MGRARQYGSTTKRSKLEPERAAWTTATCILVEEASRQASERRLCGAVRDRCGLLGELLLAESTAVLGTLVRDETDDNERDDGDTGENTKTDRQDLQLLSRNLESGLSSGRRRRTRASR